MLQGTQAPERYLAKQHSVDVASSACCILHHTHAVVSKHCPEDVAVKEALFVFRLNALRLVAVYYICMLVRLGIKPNGDSQSCISAPKARIVLSIVIAAHTSPHMHRCRCHSSACKETRDLQNSAL